MPLLDDHPPVCPGAPSSWGKIEARPLAGMSNTFIVASEFSVEWVLVGTTEFVTGKTIPYRVVNYR